MLAKIWPQHGRRLYSEVRICAMCQYVPHQTIAILFKDQGKKGKDFLCGLGNIDLGGSSEQHFDI